MQITGSWDGEGWSDNNRMRTSNIIAVLAPGGAGWSSSFIRFRGGLLLCTVDEEEEEEADEQWVDEGGLAYWWMVVRTNFLVRLESVCGI